ncbi:hypothetical protein C8N46_104283 [Kordia periserrulae]|uniref:Uncharacterized protein n=1 Tax=Kordia periserrulae TaxID=701523 RepID=A0A2T6C004_9FLAO|nr:hypothetical protein [Kordia periserrulae]PTX61640.1 hypothetical protein C8N46_104283 [Kordia periserrulae]
MSVKDFFIAVIRIMAIYLFSQGIISISHYLTYSFDIDNSSTMFWSVSLTLLFSTILYFLFRKTSAIVTFLGLDKGFSSNHFNFSNTESKYIVEIAITIMGLFLVFMKIPYMLENLYILIKSSYSTLVLASDYNFRPLQQDLIINFLHILVGLVIIFLRKPIANLFTTNTDKA